MHAKVALPGRNRVGHAARGKRSFERDLVEASLANWGGGKPKGSANPVKLRGKSAAQMVIEDRR